jgi:DNA-directed RNA polymerase specialized sigma24 family protein
MLITSLRCGMFPPSHLFNGLRRRDFQAQGKKSGLGLHLTRTEKRTLRKKSDFFSQPVKKRHSQAIKGIEKASTSNLTAQGEMDMTDPPQIIVMQYGTGRGGLWPFSRKCVKCLSTTRCCIYMVGGYLMSGLLNGNNVPWFECVNWPYVYDIIRPSVCDKLLYGLLVPDYAVEDYFMEVILRLMQKEKKEHQICNYDDAKIKYYACGIATNVVRESRKKYATRKKIEQENQGSFTSYTKKPFEIYDIEIYESVNDFSKIERAILKMIEEGRTPNEISIKLGLSKSKFYSLRNQIQQKLKGEI